MPQDTFDDKSTFGKARACHHQATSHCFSVCWTTWHQYINHSELTHWGWDKMVATSQTTVSNTFLWIKCMNLLKISVKIVPMGPINNSPALVQTMAWHQPGNKPLSELMMVSLLMPICITRPQWFNWKTTVWLSWDIHMNHYSSYLTGMKNMWYG